MFTLEQWISGLDVNGAADVRCRVSFLPGTFDLTFAELIEMLTKYPNTTYTIYKLK